MENSPKSSRQPVALAAALVLLLLTGFLVHRALQRAEPVAPPQPQVPAHWTGPLEGGGQSLLAHRPDWPHLLAFAGTMQEAEIRQSLQSVYAPTEDTWTSILSLRPGELIIRTEGNAATPQAMALPLATAASGASPPPRYWRRAQDMKPAPADQPLQGIHFAIDPGHIGGNWAKMEERWYQLKGQGPEVKEGEMTLATAQLLRPLLEALGAKVSMIRETTEPVTSFRPEDFTQGERSRKEAERFFYRQSEIRARADLINQQLKPDVVLCLHLNAEPWGGDPLNPTLVPTNHLHLLVNGHYAASELALDDQRYEMLLRLLQRTHEEEIPLSVTVAQAMAQGTGLPAYSYNFGHMMGNAHQADPASDYVWARNLLASRLYQCPVVFCEPYVMNCQEVYDRIVAGDYEGEREVAGKSRPSLYREYAAAVAQGLETYYRLKRPMAAAK
jgi:N-acetylmuramoyl-L-alanine amidase